MPSLYYKKTLHHAIALLSSFIEYQFVTEIKKEVNNDA